MSSDHDNRRNSTGVRVGTLCLGLAIGAGLVDDASSAKRRPSDYGVPAIASAYGPGLYGNYVAGAGVRGCPSRLGYDSVIVAHKGLPFGLKVIIRYRGRSVAARVCDRGPYVGRREFDLGPGVWKRLGFRSAYAFGVRTVRVRAVWP